MLLQAKHSDTTLQMVLINERRAIQSTLHGGVSLEGSLKKAPGLYGLRCRGEKEFKCACSAEWNKVTRKSMHSASMGLAGLSPGLSHRGLS